ncbi:hypothetical protein FUA23_17165, partial [Neolewinella aurantiaca]
GELTVEVTGGAEPYTITWNTVPAQSGPTATGLTAGTYTASIVDANGCETTAEGTITEPAELTASIADAALDCFEDADGELTVTVNGGTEGYTITWNTVPAQSGPTATGLTAGTYTASIVDANGCETTAEGTITEPAELTASIADAAVDCFEDANGELTVTVNGGTEGYMITWNTVPAQSGPTATGLTAGTYIASIVDANGCEVTAEGTITEPTELDVTGTTTDINCDGDASGSIDVTVTGGTPAYSYVWGDDNTVTTEDRTGLAAGTYVLTVTDENGCEEVETFTIEGATTLEATIADAALDCYGDADGELTVEVTGGAEPYTITWNTVPAQSGPTATGLTAGTYTASIVDANGCETTAEGTITEPADPLNIDETITELACNESTGGEINLDVTGGTAPYTYAWTGPGITNTTSDNQTGLGAGIYTVEVTDAALCTISESYTIAPSFTLTASVENDTICLSSADRGELTVVVLNGSGNYSFNWSNANESAETVTGLVAGTYTVTITDLSTGCIITEVARVVEDASACSSLGNFVWSDTNGNGIQDADEPGVADVVVNLKDENGNVIASTTTDENGEYLFDLLVPGTYSVQFILPDGFEWTTLGAVAGANEALDSDADPAMDGMTEQVFVSAGEFYDDLDAGIVPVITCELLAEVTVDPVCDDNGSTSDPLDDYYTMTILVTGTSPSGEWTSGLVDRNGNAISGTVGVPLEVELSAYAGNDDPIQAVSIIVTDAQDATCTAEFDYTPVGPCSNRCRINAFNSSSPVCNDNGTESDPSDDFFTLGITARGINEFGASWTVSTMDGRLVGTGIYGEETPEVGPFTEDDVVDGVLRLNVQDADEPSCNYVVSIAIAPGTLPCSDACTITIVQLGESICDDNGTPTISSDDQWWVSAEVRGTNVNNWTSTTPGGEGNNSFGTNISFGYFPNPISGTQTITVTSVGVTPTCSATIQVVAPGETCSDECDITAELTVGECNDNGTATPFDDFFYITVTANSVGENNSPNGWVLIEGDHFTDTEIGSGTQFGQEYTFGPFPTHDENGNVRTTQDYRIEDADDIYCDVEFYDVVLPEPCSEPIQCLLEVELLGTDCDNNGTPADGNDDTYCFDVIVSGGTGGYTIRYTAPAGRADETGVFGETMTYCGFGIGENVRANIIPDDENCTEIAALLVQSPEECVDCILEVEELSNVCDDNGTADPSDDTYIVTVAVHHQGLGNFYMVDVPGEGMVLGQYGTSDTIKTFEFLISDGDVTLEFLDMQNQGQCNDEITFTAPTEPCGDCQIMVVDFTTTECNQNGTELDGSDDTFTATFTVTGFNTGDNWVTADGTYTGTYGVATTLTLPTGTADLVLDIVDADDASCGTELTIPVPNSCEEEPECDISVVIVSASRCNDDGGYEFDVTVTNSGAGSENGWVITGTEYSGTYGETVTITVDDVCGDNEFVFRDASDETCEQIITGRAPEVGIEAPADTDMVNDRTLICTDYNEIFNVEGSLANTGVATVSGCGDITIDFNDTFISGGPDATAGCDETVIRRIFTASVCDGTMVADTQLITIRKPLVSDVIFPTDTIDFDCEGEGFPTDVNGNPATSVTGIPAIVTAFGDTTRFDDEFCGTLNVAYNDVVEQTCSGTQTIRRTWTATSECSDDVLSAEQIIRTGDFSAPVVSCPISNHYCPVLEDDIMLFPMDYFDCVANFTAPLPDVTDACSDSWTIVTYVVDELGLGDTVLVIGNDDDRALSLGAGDYVFRYAVSDDCGNVGTTDCRFRVADTQEPAAICISDINVSVGGYGVARIYSQMIDLGSYDNCGIDSILVRRELLIDPITGDSLSTPIWSDWGAWAEVVCEDAGTVVALQLRVVDFGGNVNVCTTNAAVVDNTLPYCTGLEDLFLTCDEVPSDLDANDTLSLQAAFGRPVVIDNCSAESIELTPIVDYDACSESGTIIRRWLAIDGIGNVSAQEFTQRITITSDMGFTMVLPKDTLTDCLDEYQGFEIIGAGCADISVTYQDTIVEAVAADGDACLVIERKYIIINNCMFNPETDDLMVISRDEDCDGEQGESIFYAIVDGDSTYVDVDTDFGNAIPAAGTRGTECDGESNATGRLRSFATTGGWTYTQRISIFDETNPVLNYEVPPVFCATEEEGCETVIEIPITISGECTAAGSNWLVMIDLGRDGNPEMRLQTDLAVQGTFPNYFIKAAMPLGEHNLIIRYVDGCNNAVSAAIPFEIVDCSIPDPICYSGLIANLETLETPVVDSEGNEITVGAIVDAGRLASCNIEDCTGPLRYSVNRIGDVPHVDSTDIVLTCEDRYTVDLEVYMWDSAFNPFAVQPDGTVGGPNWKMCVVEVLVQDPNTLCNDCNADGSLTLGGSITTSLGVVLPGVEVEMQGEMTGLELTGDDGKYAFPGVTAGSYSITPYKEDIAANGVSTLDELILQRHLLGLQMITDPLVFMAADLNNSGTLTVIDRLLMRNIILGNTEVLPGNETWRFVPVSYFEAVGDELDRMMDAPRKIDLANVDACTMGNDFYAIKMGDLNNSVFIQSATGNILNGTRGRSSNETQKLEIEERRLQGGDFFDLPVRAIDLEGISGMQFTLGFADEALEVEEVVPGLLTEDQLGLRFVDRGYVSANWTQPGEMVDGEAVLFTVRLRSLRPGLVSDAVHFVDNPTFTEAYSIDDEALMTIVLNVNDSSLPSDQDVMIGGFDLGAMAVVELSQNVPNPFNAETTITFNLPEAGDARLNVYDFSGRVLSDISGEFEAGVNSVKLQGRNLPAGAMVYTLTFKGERLSRTMVRAFS